MIFKLFLLDLKKKSKKSESNKMDIDHNYATLALKHSINLTLA